MILRQQAALVLPSHYLCNFGWNLFPVGFDFDAGVFVFSYGLQLWYYFMDFVNVL